jgi:hypothetical protein
VCVGELGVEGLVVVVPNPQLSKGKVEVVAAQRIDQHLHHLQRDAILDLVQHERDRRGILKVELVVCVLALARVALWEPRAAQEVGLQRGKNHIGKHSGGSSVTHRLAGETVLPCDAPHADSRVSSVSTDAIGSIIVDFRDVSSATGMGAVAAVHARKHSIGKLN